MGTDRNIGVALSGGGHRATSFSLGALLALVDSGLNHDTLSVSSVSGGSIANAATMTGSDFGTLSSAEFEAQIRPALQVIAHRGLLLGGAPATKHYVIALAASIVLGVVSLISAIVIAIVGWPAASIGAFVASVVFVVAAWHLFRQRSERTERAIDDEMLGGSKITLAEVKRRASSVHHVICTTELQSGEPMYFTNRGVYNYRFRGSTVDTTLPLATAVQASACVPGAFNPRVIPLTRLGLESLSVPAGAAKSQSTTVIDAVVLNDGGVYDNMADEWEYGYPNRATSWPELATIQPHRARYLVVVNGSGGWNHPKPIPKGALAQELQGLLRAQGVQYDVSTTHRRRALYSLFRESERRAAGSIDGIFAQITDSPYRIPAALSAANLAAVTDGSRWDETIARRADEATAFLNAQGYSPGGWSEVVARTSGAPTSLAKFGTQLTAELLEHGYVLTMILLYVLDGKGSLLPIDRTRFAALCA